MIDDILTVAFVASVMTFFGWAVQPKYFMPELYKELKDRS